jgi:hypothetical protein
LFVIITTYLRVVWRDGMLDSKPFVEHSLDLLTAFWGQPWQPGAWQAMHPRLTDDLLTHGEERLTLSAQTWLHAYAVAELLGQDGDRRIYDLAAWMRYLDTAPDVLATLSEDVYRRLWRASFPSHVEFLPAAEVVTRLREISQWYDEIALKTEISTWSGARARSSEGTIAGLRQVPKLEVTLPLSDADLDRCLQAFQVFLVWPQHKRFAWARFTNTNPLVKENDLRRLNIFYRGDRRSLVFAAQRKSEEYHPDIEVLGVTVDKLSKVRSIDELAALRSNT